MPDQIQTKVNTALAEWEVWNGLGVANRNAIVLRWAEFVATESSLGVMAEKMIKFQSYNALDLLKDELLPGPTGETNELYSSGRGMFVISADKHAAIYAIVAQISAALLAGNCIFIVLEPKQAELTKVIINTLLAAGVPGTVVQWSNYQSLETVIKTNHIAGVAYVGNMPTTLVLNRQLAARHGQLVQFIAETDRDKLNTVTDSHYILRFITQRTRTINITAVGGNATLLELGSGGH
ncbi:MAG: delta 1-pyrroline-5-carboxylate dehydrogenase [Moritella sp.]|jgi:delta 1-pyrroline-5-carboxylate dehydrogenase